MQGSKMFLCTLEVLSIHSFLVAVVHSGQGGDVHFCYCHCLLRLNICVCFFLRKHVFSDCPFGVDMDAGVMWNWLSRVWTWFGRLGTLAFFAGRGRLEIYIRDGLHHCASLDMDRVSDSSLV